MLRESQVREERAAGVVEQDVLRLHVAVHDASPVRRREGGRERAPDRDRLVDPERPALEAAPQRAAREERHDEVGPPGTRPRVEERDEALAGREASEEPPLALEPGDRVRVGPREELDRDLAAIARPSAMDRSHAAPSDGSAELVGPEVHVPDEDSSSHAGSAPGAELVGPDLHFPGETFAPPPPQRPARSCSSLAWTCGTFGSFGASSR